MVSFFPKTYSDWLFELLLVIFSTFFLFVAIGRVFEVPVLKPRYFFSFYFQLLNSLLFSFWLVGFVCVMVLSVWYVYLFFVVVVVFYLFIYFLIVFVCFPSTRHFWLCLAEKSENQSVKQREAWAISSLKEAFNFQGILSFYASCLNTKQCFQW